MEPEQQYIQRRASKKTKELKNYATYGPVEETEDL